MNSIALIILAAVLGDFGLHLVADLLNLTKIQSTLPESFRGWYDDTQYKSSQEYLSVNTRFEWLAGFTDLTLFLCLWFGKGFPLLDKWVRSASNSTIACGLIYIGVLFLLKFLISLPFSIYSTFVIEERFGFNKTSPRVFVTDLLKQVFLSGLIAGILISAIIAFFEYAGSNAWMYCWVLVVLFMVAMQVVIPTFIMPLFNKFTPLAEGDLKSAIVSYAGAIRFPLENIFVMDGSRRSSKSNAFFMGLGRHRRIVLYDTLIANHSVPELVTILAHEMGHYKKRHIFWMTFAGICQAGLMLYLMSLVMSSPKLFAAFYMDSPSIYAGLLFFTILYTPVGFFTGILMQIFSRKNEYSADRFAVETTHDPHALISALIKLTIHNLSNLTPHPFYVFLNYSHPPVLDRIRAIGRP